MECLYLVDEMSYLGAVGLAPDCDETVHDLLERLSAGAATGVDSRRQHLDPSAEPD